MSFDPPRNHLVRELSQRRAVVVLGAGASASSVSKSGLHPPTWEGLLRKGIDLLHDGLDRSQAVQFIDNHQYLEAAEIFVRRSDDADRENFYRACFATPNFKASGLHEAVRSIDAKVVVTTNYDEVYDQLCRTGDGADGYSVIKYYDDNRFIEVMRSDQRLIVKAHGCVTDPARLILSRSQYQAARFSRPQFFNNLDAVFTLNTVLFIGCSLDDPDLQLLLQHAALSTPSSRSHYALIPDSVPRPIQDSFREAFHIEPWLYKTSGGSHGNATLALEDLAARVIANRATA